MKDYVKATKVFFQKYGKISAPFLQRQLQISYEMAKQLIEEIEPNKPKRLYRK